MLAPLARAFDRVSLLAAVAAEGWELDLAEAECATGWENVALVGSDWVVRFPRDDEVDFATELEVLQLVDGRLGVATPHVEHVGRLTRCLAYRRLDGFGWSREAYVEATEDERDRLAASCAAALTAMHALIDERPSRTTNVSPAVQPSWLHDLEAQLRGRVEAMLDELRHRWQCAAERGFVLLHNDFHLLNAVQRDPVGPLTGLWDFSCVAVGPPELDLRYLEGSLVGPWTEPIELHGLRAHDHLERVAYAYRDRTGRELDLRLAVLANRLENLEDLGAGHVARSIELWDEVDRFRDPRR